MEKQESALKGKGKSIPGREGDRCEGPEVQRVWCVWESGRPARLERSALGERRDEVERWTRAGWSGPCGRGRTLNFIVSVVVAGVGVEQKRDV